ncbi:PRC and DUF2382 domain-containing protein [Glaciihabitans sp. UYNi722]|uniref:PRC and DUF2382 domain-containing protein n=1 Tax=Glaciihabitans sp. UYNi722 TaxID=3156344 RepID=UPI00339A15AA
MIETSNINDLIGAEVFGADNTKIGTVGQVYVDAENQSPSWVTIKTGLFGTSESFAPLDNASFDGETVRVEYDKDFVKDAPRIADDGSLSEEEENSLYTYYGNGTGVRSQDADFAAADAHGTETIAEGYDVSGSTSDEAMTRSEERLRVGTEKVESGRARLVKHIVTENVTTTVPVSHEEVSLVREPITEANRADATAGPALSSEEHEVVLTEERVIVTKETVPVERVALGTETITEQQDVNAEVAHEEINLVDPTTTTTTNADTNPDANSGR